MDGGLTNWINMVQPRQDDRQWLRHAAQWQTLIHLPGRLGTCMAASEINVLLSEHGVTKCFQWVVDYKALYKLYKSAALHLPFTSHSVSPDVLRNNFILAVCTCDVTSSFAAMLVAICVVWIVAHQWSRELCLHISLPFHNNDNKKPPSFVWDTSCQPTYSTTTDQWATVCQKSESMWLSDPSWNNGEQLVRTHLSASIHLFLIQSSPITVFHFISPQPLYLWFYI